MPTHADRPTSEVVLENSATFICGARGLTTPEITWRLNDVDAQENENAVYERISSNDTTMIHQLTLNQVQDTDSGTITCVARITGSDVPVEQNTTLSVLSMPFYDFPIASYPAVPTSKKTLGWLGTRLTILH